MVSYDHDGNFMVSYENYTQFKAKDTMPNALNFESTCISVTFGNQEKVLPISYSLNHGFQNVCTSQPFFIPKFFEQESRPTPLLLS